MKETFNFMNNFLWRGMQIFGKQGITFIIFIISAKLLTPYLFGIYSYSLAIIFLLIIFGDFGISTATSKYVAEYNVTDKDKLKAVLFNSGIIILGLTIIITLLTLTLGKFYLGDKYVYVLYLLPLIFLAPMTSLYDGIYRGLKKFKQLAIISTIVGLVSLSFVYILIKQYGLIGALIAQNLFYFILLLALAFGYREFHFKINKSVMKEIGAYSFHVGITEVSYFMFISVSLIILGSFGYLVEAGYYELINRFLFLIILPFMILGQVLAPQNSEDYLFDKNKVFKRFRKNLKISIIASLVLLILSLSFSQNIAHFFFEEYSSPLFNSLIILFSLIIPARIISALMNHGFLFPLGYSNIFSRIILVFGILNVILSYILVGMFGPIGIAFSTLIVWYSTVLITLFILNKNLSKQK